jgi:hypothetical protein
MAVKISLAPVNGRARWEQTLWPAGMPTETLESLVTLSRTANRAVRVTDDLHPGADERVLAESHVAGELRPVEQQGAGAQWSPAGRLGDDLTCVLSA